MFHDDTRPGSKRSSLLLKPKVWTLLMAASIPGLFNLAPYVTSTSSAPRAEPVYFPSQFAAPQGEPAQPIETF